jgi:hypothetical protein
MKNPKAEIRRPKESRKPKTESGYRSARSFLECGSLLPLFQRRGESARGLTQFKTWRLRLLLFCHLTSTFCLCAKAQYSLDWSTVDGGGGASTGGVYAVNGTIGQPDAGAMSGGNYTLQGGFWGIIAAVQTPGAPLLSVWRTTTNTVVVSWPSPSTGFALYQNTNLSTTNWVSPPETVHDNGTNKFILVNPPTGNRFYRLKK